MHSKFRNSVTLIMLILMFQIQLESVYALYNPLVTEEMDEQDSNVSATATMQNQTSKSYPFVPGDAISISTFPDTTSFLNNVFAIDDAGMVEFPILGKFRITGMSIPELQEFLKAQFKAYLRYPNVIVKPMIRVSILGGVPNPGLYYVDEQNSLWEVMKMAGGTSMEEGLTELHWERNHDEVIDDLIPYFQSGISLRQMGFKSGDQLWTPSERPRTFTEIFSTQIMPLITFATTMFLLYWNYQVQIRLIETGRSNYR